MSECTITIREPGKPDKVTFIGNYITDSPWAGYTEWHDAWQREADEEARMNRQERLHGWSEGA